MNLESIVIVIMIIVGDLIRNQVVGRTTEKYLFHSWQTREIFRFPVVILKDQHLLQLGIGRHFLIGYVLHKPSVTGHSPLYSVNLEFGL